MNNYVLGLILGGLVCIGIGFLLGVIWENTRVNYEITNNIETAAQTTQNFRIGTDSYYIEKVDYDKTCRDVRCIIE